MFDWHSLCFYSRAFVNANTEQTTTRPRGAIFWIWQKVYWIRVMVSRQSVILHLPCPLRLQLAHLHRFHNHWEYWWPAPVTPTLKPLTPFTRCRASFDNGLTIPQQQVLYIPSSFSHLCPVCKFQFQIGIKPFLLCSALLHFVFLSLTRSFLFRTSVPCFSQS